MNGLNGKQFLCVQLFLFFYVVHNSFYEWIKRKTVFIFIPANLYFWRFHTIAIKCIVYGTNVYYSELFFSLLNDGYDNINNG